MELEENAQELFELRPQYELPFGTEFPFTPKALEFPHSTPKPKGNALILRGQIYRFWEWGMQLFVNHYIHEARGVIVRNIDWDVLQPDKKFVFTQRQISVMLIKHLDDVRKTRQALQIGVLLAADHIGNWQFTQTELLQYMTGVFAYGYARRFEIAKQRERMEEKYKK